MPPELDAPDKSLGLGALRDMTGFSAIRGAATNWSMEAILPAAVTALAFTILFAQPFVTLLQDWWSLPDAGHGLLLGPVAVWLAWRSGIRPDATPNRAIGIAILVFAVLLRCAAGLAAELFTMRGSMILALAGLTVYHYGVRQLVHWWLPFLLACLTVPLPAIVTNQIALPLQFRASRFGAALLSMRGIPVAVKGNIIYIPGRQLFVAEACSGLRSLTALISVAVLLSAMVLETPIARVVVLLLAIPIAIVVNGIRVFFTGFLVEFVSPAFGDGFMHETEGWLLFLVSLATLGLVAWILGIAERKLTHRNAEVPVVPQDGENLDA